MRDFFYNKNDIIIVILILIVAGILIYNRIGVIMDYPTKIANDTVQQTEQQVDEESTSDEE